MTVREMKALNKRLIVFSLIVAICIVAFAQSAQSKEDEIIAYIHSEYDPPEGIVEVGIRPGDTEDTGHEYSDILSTMTDREYELLRRIVAAESQTQGLTGRIAVTEVILNRVAADDYPDSVHKVLSQSGQFVTWKYRNAKWVEPEYADEAIEYVSENGLTVLPNMDYEYFSRGLPDWAKNPIKIEDHWFWTD